MSKNICYQMRSAIDNAFSPGSDKHSDKRNRDGSGYKIYSYASRDEMRDFCWDFSNYIKENYSEVKKVKDIDIEIINNYLSFKSKQGITQATMDSLVARVNKLELCCMKKFPIEIDWRSDRIIPIQEKKEIRHVVFTDEQILGLEKYFSTKRDSYSKYAFMLGKSYGLRAASVVNIRACDIDLDKMTLKIYKDKGGRTRVLKIKPEDTELFKTLTRGKKAMDLVIPLKSDSICKYLNEACKKLNYENIYKNKTSFHCLRKWAAQQKYKELLEKGMSQYNAEYEVCKWLGHSSRRVDIISRYLF